ncbi:MAG: type III polyketide synthase, partial [Verrucomicrobiota bacterium]
MATYLHSIETTVPEHVHTQDAIEELFVSHIDDRRTQLLIKKSLRGTKIDKRHSVCPGFFNNELFDENGKAPTSARNKVYARESRRLAVQLGEKIIADSPTFSKEDITHVVFASCTGFANPGPDYFLVADMGLRHDCQRLLIGFMGCY